MKKIVIILGAGLSGLLTAKRLEESGREALILESRDRIGGRIYTKMSNLQTPVEMGATWFGKKHVHLVALLEELGISYYEQHTAGTAYFEPFSLAPPQEIDIPVQLPSFRIQGGSATLINTLAASLRPEQIYLNTKVQSLQFADDSIIINSTQGQHLADMVISTVPPALLFRDIKMSPEPRNEIKALSLATHTWMQDAIKTALVYKEPFWRSDNGSGTVFSNVGPVSEFYDHSDHLVEKFALCGFVNGGYAAISADERKSKVLAQLEKFYGKVVHDFVSYEEYIWSQDPHTKHADCPDIFPHQNNGHPLFQNSIYEDRFIISGSETATHFPGYMDGAVESAEFAVAKCLNTDKKPKS